MIKISNKWLLKLIGFWPPYLGTGIRVCDYKPDMSFIKVQMKLHFWNQNYVGTQFGGSLYAMTDPFYMLMLMSCLGKDYIVWDKSAAIKYVKPGKGTVFATFNLTPEQIDDFQQQLKTKAKIEPEFKIEIKDGNGDIVAVVQKIIHIQKKSRSKIEVP